MFPMVSEVAEFDEAKALLDRELELAARRGTALPSAVHVGVMLEVPSLYFQLAALLPRIDFLSVGSNDLQQFFFACDRGSQQVGERYDSLSPALLRFLRDVARQCENAGVPFGLCGEMAGDPIEAMALIGIGFRRLSMNASATARIRLMTRSLNLTGLAAYIDTIIDGADHTLRNKLADFARDHGVRI